MRKSRHITVFFASLSGALILSAGAFVAVVNRVGRNCVVSEVWLPDVLKMKRLFAERTPSPRIIVSAGSGALFGVDSAVLSDALDMPVVNMALHAMLPFEYHCAELCRMARPGDIVVMPLEISHFYREEFHRKGALDFPLSVLFGVAPEYQRALSGRDLVRIYSRYGLSWILRNLRGQTHCADMPTGALYRCWEALHGQPGYGGYGFHGLTERGDMLVRRPTVSADYERWEVMDILTPSFVRAWQALASEMESRGVRVILTWSNLMWYPDRDGFESFRDRLSCVGICLKGRPEAFSFPISCYYDTEYHLNAFGARLNARELAKVIGAEIGRKPHFSEEAVHHVVFAEEPQESFPQTENLVAYGSGVRIPAGKTRLRISIPGSQRGKAVEANLIVDADAARMNLSAVCGALTLKTTVVPHARRQEVRMVLPREVTKVGSVDVDLSFSSPVGFERMTLLDAIPAVRLVSGFAAEGTEGDRSECVLAVPDEVRGRTAIFEMLVLPNDERLSVRCRERELAHFAFDGKRQLLRIPVPASLTEAEVLPLEFLIEGVKSPLERGFSPDTRKLGPRIMSMKLVVAER